MFFAICDELLHRQTISLMAKTLILVSILICCLQFCSRTANIQW